MPDENEIVERLVRIETKLDGFMSACEKKHVPIDKHLDDHPERVEELHRCSEFCGNIAKAMWLIIPASIAVAFKGIITVVTFLFKERIL